ncbi:Elongator complex protein 4 [Phakopsora pachyrhizi]|uniref:Elongator complex protein 4 n=1 Tax=Phakopsora pachyrhizi TaxID=170000 RepID=A0AAV0BQH2_PHAPC|nr:Elongator complex protein 4 [Phakopsora pachyrhizi]CAH7687853.1 Elongator complex protein 4 [Phakopsora pachyrhizi]
MSSFIRNVSNKLGATLPCPVGFHPSLYNGLPTASTGISSLDDVIGGGIPISSSFIIDEDADSSYARLVLRYWIAQGISSGQNVIVVGSSLDENGDPKEIVEHLMSLDQDLEDSAAQDETTQSAAPCPNESDSENDEKLKTSDSRRMKIAWRYESMKKHQAEAESSQMKAHCYQFNLSKTLRLSADQRSRVHCIDVVDYDSYNTVINALNDIIHKISKKNKQQHNSASFRIAMQSFGSPGWPSQGQTANIFSFLLGLKQVLQKTAAVATLTFPGLQYPVKLRKMLPWTVDCYMSLESFAGDEASQAAFPNHQGAANFIRLPSAGSLLPPATKLSVLRGLGGTSYGARIDSNLGFKLGRRKGFRIEMMGLGLDLDSQATAGTSDQRPEKSDVKFESSSTQEFSSKSKVFKVKSKVRFGEPSQDQSKVKDLGNIEW